jgi:hypothetical protein
MITTVDGVAERGMGAVDVTTGARHAAFGFSADNDVLGPALGGQPAHQRLVHHGQRRGP